MLQATPTNLGYSRHRATPGASCTSAAKWRFASALPAAALLATALSASPAFAADSGDSDVISLNPTTIEVKSDGSKYTQPAIALVSLSAQTYVIVDPGVSGRVKSWKNWLVVKAENGISVSFSNHAAQQSYSTPRPKSVNKTVGLNIPYGTIAPYVTGHCNLLADSLRNNGLSNAQIFAQDRVIKVSAVAALHYETTGVGSQLPQEIHLGKNFNVVCKAAPGPQRVPPTAGEPTRNVPDVDQATLTVHEVTTLGGTCKLNLSGVIVTKEPNKQVKFRYKDNDGHQSDVKTVMTDHSSTVFFNHQYSLFGGGHKQGQIRIDIEGENVNSPWSNYDVDCPAGGAPGGVVQQGGVKPGPVAQGAATNLKPQNPVNPDAGVPSKRAPQGTPRPGAIKADLGKPDMMATTLGMSMAGGMHAWGSNVTISNPALASAKGVGAGGKMCRFSPVAFRPFNKGTAPSGMFQTTVYRNNQPVHSANFNLAPKSGLPSNSGWHKFNLDLAQGMNVIKVVLDPNKTVAESNEGNNTYMLHVRVDFPCTAAQSGAPSRMTAPTRQPPGTNPTPKPGKAIIVPMPNLKTK